MKGFINLGNTCYLNSGLQMIIRIESIYKKLSLYKTRDKDLDIIINFFDRYYQGKDDIMDPGAIKKIIGKRKSNFSGFNQEDSEEFINYLIDFLDEKCSNININDKSAISNLIESKVEKSIKCKAVKCLTISKSEESFIIIPLSITNETNNLDDCFFEFMKREKLENDSLYYCDKCQKKRIASKRMEMKKLPKNLLISLKRFDSNLRKINKEIDFPLDWRMYKLKGVVFHSGNFGGGHYVYIGTEDDRWFLFNDSFVNEIRNVNALNQYKNFGYLYHYEKI